MQLFYHLLTIHMISSSSTDWIKKLKGPQFAHAWSKMCSNSPCHFLICSLKLRRLWQHLACAPWWQQMYRQLVTRAGSNILLIFRYVSQTGGASFFFTRRYRRLQMWRSSSKSEDTFWLECVVKEAEWRGLFFRGVEITLASLPLTLKNSGRPSCHQHFGQPKWLLTIGTQMTLWINSH